MQIATPVDTFKQVLKKGRNIVDIKSWIVIFGSDQQVLGEGELPLSKDSAGLGEQFLGVIGLVEGGVTFTADGQQQRMNAGGINGMYRFNAGKHIRDERTGQLVDKGTEAGILLWRPADGSEGPDRIRTMVDAFYLEHRKIMGQAVIAKVVAERSFPFKLIRG